MIHHLIQFYVAIPGALAGTIKAHPYASAAAVLAAIAYNVHAIRRSRRSADTTKER